MRVKQWGRFGAVLLAAVLWAAQGQAAAPALAANNLTVNCTGGDYTLIMDAVDDATNGATITVCAGDYSENVNIQNFTSLKLIGKDGPRLTPPNDPYIGAILEVHDSDKVTVSGFIVDGNDEFSNLSVMVGIWWENSGGLITGNVIRNITRYTTDTEGIGIELTNSTNTLRKVTVTKNAVVNTQFEGIHAGGNNQVKVSKNRISMSLLMSDEPSAITLNHVANGSAVESNTIVGDWRHGIPYLAYGIRLVTSSNTKIGQNTIMDWPIGIALYDDDCASPADTSNNTITKNTLIDVRNGIYLESSGGMVCESHVDGTKITSNKIYSHYSPGDANLGILLFTSVAPPITNTTITGNQVLGTFNNAIMDVGGVGTTGLVPQKNTIGPMPPPGM